ncbi:MAG: IPTL-CTERM sorting domain-containing protein, partial [Thermoanaerobaculia bacterium]
TNLIPFTLDGALPGNQVAHLQVTLAPTATPGTIITLTIDPTTLTQLTDQAGTPGTVENTGNARLTVVNGSITVVPVVPALSHIALMLLAIALGVVAIRIRS